MVWRCHGSHLQTALLCQCCHPRYHTAAEARQALDQAGELLAFCKFNQLGAPQGGRQAPDVIAPNVLRAVQRVIARDPDLYWAAPLDVWGDIAAPTPASAAVIQADAEPTVFQVPDAVTLVAVEGEAAVAAAAVAAPAYHFEDWQQPQLEQDQEDPLTWLLQPAQQLPLLQQPFLLPEVVAAADAAAQPVWEDGLHGFVDLLLGPYDGDVSDASYTTAPQPASSNDTTATSPAAAAAAAGAASLPVPFLLHGSMPRQSQSSMAVDPAAVASPHTLSPAAASSSTVAAIAVGQAATFLGLATGYELMMFSSRCFEHLLELYNQHLVQLMGVPNAPVRSLLLQWLPSARQAISSSGQPVGVQQAVMQLLSKMVQLLLTSNASSSSASGGSFVSPCRGVASTAAGCELVFSVVERLVRSLEELVELCSQNYSGLMEHGAAASTMQLWRAQMVSQPDLPASSIISQLMQQLGA